MRITPLLTLSALLLTACGTTTGALQKDNLKNPLYAAQYYADLTERMVNLELQKDPVTKDARKKAIIDQTRKNGVANEQRAASVKAQGQEGTFVSDSGLVRGEVLLLKHTLFFGVDFAAVPGPELHVFVSTVLDPRDVRFPDSTAVDLGPLPDVFGAQSMSIAETADLSKMRSAVLHDVKLGQMYGFAQLSK